MASKRKYLYRCVEDHWATNGPVYLVRKYTLVGRSEKMPGCMRVKEGLRMAEDVHPDWLHESPEAAIEHTKKVLRESFEKRIAAVDAARSEDKTNE